MPFTSITHKAGNEEVRRELTGLINKIAFRIEQKTGADLSNEVQTKKRQTGLIYPQKPGITRLA